jgi:hypothetical protein
VVCECVSVFTRMKAGGRGPADLGGADDDAVDGRACWPPDALARDVDLGGGGADDGRSGDGDAADGSVGEGEHGCCDANDDDDIIDLRLPSLWLVGDIIDLRLPSLWLVGDIIDLRLPSLWLVGDIIDLRLPSLWLVGDIIDLRLPSLWPDLRR